MYYPLTYQLCDIYAGLDPFLNLGDYCESRPNDFGRRMKSGTHKRNNHRKKH